MKKATKAHRAKLWRGYCREQNAPFFALIGAVIEGIQNGVIYCPDALGSEIESELNEDPQCFWVVTPFGFSQVITLTDDAAIANAWFEQVANALKASEPLHGLELPPKVRLFAVQPELASLLVEAHMVRSERVQWDYPHQAVPADVTQQPSSHPNVHPLTAADIDKVNQAIDFQIDGRFWPSAKAYERHGLGCYYSSSTKDTAAESNQAKVLSACYSCAVSNGCAEVDITTVTECHGQGLGVLTGQGFIASCLAKGLKPKWDCFTNNAGSMKLAKKLGFVPRTPYIYFTVNLQGLR